MRKKKSVFEVEFGIRRERINRNWIAEFQLDNLYTLIDIKWLLMKLVFICVWFGSKAIIEMRLRPIQTLFTIYQVQGISECGHRRYAKIYCNCLSWVEWIQSSFGWIIFSVYWLHLARVLYGAQIWMLAPLILHDCLLRAYMHTGSELTECGTKHMTHVKPNQLNLFA